MAVVKSAPASSPMSKERMVRDFIAKFQMPENLDECTYAVPIESIVHPLCVPRTMVAQTGNFSALFHKGSGVVILVNS
jgi:hypothetical protein